MFGLGFPEIVVILVLALVLLGPKRLPDVAKQLGKGLREFKKATDDLKSQFESELYAEDTKPRERPALVPQEPAPTPSGSPPAATAENVPGLEAATAEPAPAPERPQAGAAAEPAASRQA